MNTFFNPNDTFRNEWLRKVLTSLPVGLRLLDAGAGELKNRKHCEHLQYVSQDLCQYEGKGDGKGLQTGKWDTARIDIVSDITAIPEPDGSFDVILCSEVFEHIPDAIPALKEFQRLLKPEGILIITAPFASLVHFAPYHFSTGFSRYWYEHHLPLHGFHIDTLIPNGDWFSFLRQELMRMPSVARGKRDWCWPLAYIFAGITMLYFLLRSPKKRTDDMACFGWQCIAEKI